MVGLHHHTQYCWHNCDERFLPPIFPLQSIVSVLMLHKTVTQKRASTSLKPPLFFLLFKSQSKYWSPYRTECIDAVCIGPVFTLICIFTEIVSLIRQLHCCPSIYLPATIFFFFCFWLWQTWSQIKKRKWFTMTTAYSHLSWTHFAADTVHSSL